MATAVRKTSSRSAASKVKTPKKITKTTSKAQGTKSKAGVVAAKSLSEIDVAVPAAEEQSKTPATEAEVSSGTEAQAPKDPRLPELRKKELINQAVKLSGIKKRDAKPAIEAALAVLGKALSEGRELNLQPFGKLKVAHRKKGINGQVIKARIRQPEGDGSIQETEKSGQD